jgi:hypothetical protein
VGAPGRGDRHPLTGRAGARAIPATVAAVCLALTGCGDGPQQAGLREEPLAASPSPTVAAPPTPSTPSATITSPSTSSTPSATAAVPAFRWRVARVSAAQLGASWHRGCPVGPASLRRVSLSHWDFAGHPRTGVLILNAGVVADTRAAFAALYRLRFPIRSIRPVSEFGASDDASMAADNTSAFNCRFVSGTTRWSQHAYGRAIDLNPLENPYVDGDHVSPPRGRRFADRSLHAKGLVHDGGNVVRAFAAVGWGWGGHWGGARDYQHFSATGT